MKRTKKIQEQEPRQLQLESTTIKVLTDGDFTLINGGTCSTILGIKSSFCK